jgi:hypothetical protein
MKMIRLVFFFGLFLVKCPICSRSFVNGEFLASHIHRRHAEHDPSRQREHDIDKEKELQRLNEQCQAQETELKLLKGQQVSCSLMCSSLVTLHAVFFLFFILI